MRGGVCEEARKFVRIASQHFGGTEDVVEAHEDVRDEEAALGETGRLRG
jgi:hypothetical protein